MESSLDHGSGGDGGLTDAQLLAVSQRVTEVGQLWTLASGGLGVDRHYTQAALTNHPGDIQGAARAVLSIWFQGQPGRCAALRNLVTALNQCSMTSIAAMLEQPKGEDPPKEITTKRLNDIQKWLRGSILASSFSSVPGKDWTIDSANTGLKQVYTPPSLERLRRVPHNVDRQPLKDLSTLLRDIQATDPQGPVRILVQAGGGMGKSTLLKHLALTWADGSSKELKKFQLVFHLALNQVKGDIPIEDIIIAQHVGLKAQKVNPAEIRSILDGDYKVLLLLDGHDEYKQGTNKDINESITKQSLWNCWMITTSRDSQLKNYMDAEVEIKGFQGNEVITFIKKTLNNPQNNPKQLLDEAVRKGLCRIDEQRRYDFTGSLLTTPYLLNMVCYLFMHKRPLPRTRTGIIDAIVSRSLDREAIRAKGQKAVDSAKQALVKLGELAWQGLQQGTRFFKKSAVPVEVLELGILVGADNVVQQEENEGIVWFQHLMLQHFAAGKYISQLPKAEVETFFPTINPFMGAFDAVLFAFGLCDQPSALSQVLYDRLHDSLLLLNSWITSHQILLLLQAELSEDSTLDMFHNRVLNYTTKDSPILCVPSKLYKFDYNAPDGAEVKYQIDEAALVGVDPAACVIEVHNQKSLLNVLNIMLEIQKHQEVFVVLFTYFPGLPGSPDLLGPLSTSHPPGSPQHDSDGNLDDDIASNWAQALRHSQRMSNFTMRGGQLSKRIHRTVVKYLWNCKQLTHLGLKEMQLQPSLAEAVSQLTRLKVIDVENCRLPRTVSEALVAALRSCVDLEHARLSGNEMTQCLKALLGGMDHNGFPRLGILELLETGLVKEDLSALAQASRNGRLPKLQIIDLTGNPLTDCLHVLFPDDSHPGYPQLDTLVLTNTTVSKLDIACLMSASQNRKLPTLRRLLMGHNNLRGCFSVQPGRTEPTFPGLDQLNVSNCDLQKSDLADINKVCSSCGILQFDSQLLTGALQGLFEGRGLPSVELLALHRTQLNGQDLVSLTNAIKLGKLPRLHQLQLFHNNLCGLEHLIYDLLRACVEARRNTVFGLGISLDGVSNTTEFKKQVTQIRHNTSVIVMYTEASIVGENTVDMKVGFM